MMTRSIAVLSVSFLAITGRPAVAEPTVSIRQLTHGPENHFFGYIGHVQNIPWNASGRYILALQTTFQNRMPGPEDAANVILIDTHNNNAIRVVEQTRGWNPQQGTMFYWNPQSPDTQFFFNDRDPESGKVFCVLFDISAGDNGERIREFRFENRPIGNGGVAQNGGWFLGINYARMARLRPVTGYKGATDWTVGVRHPSDDGVFKVNVETGQATLLASFRTIANVLRTDYPEIDQSALFINHTLSNREGDRIFFFARAGWSGQRGKRINEPFVMKADGSDLTRLKHHIGGHPEWDYGHRMIGRFGDRQILYDVDRHQIIGELGSPEIFPNPEGDIALSPSGEWFVNGYKNRDRTKTHYVFYRRSDGFWFRTEGFNIGKWASGDLRQDPGPCWNREGNQVLVPALTEDGKSRQLFVLSLEGI